MPTADRRRRVAAVAGLALLAAGLLYLALFTPTGRALGTHPQRFAADVRRLVAAHPLAAPILFFAAYLALSVLCLPVWWLQVLAGVAFGLWSGGALCLAGSAIGATITASLADYFAGRWFHDRIEPHVARLARLDQLMGRHGLLTVLTVRLTHLIPFGLSNVALGLSRVPRRTILIGTLLGNVPAVAAYVGLGAGLDPRDHWPFMLAIVALNVLGLLPLFARLWRSRRREQMPA